MEIFRQYIENILSPTSKQGDINTDFNLSFDGYHFNMILKCGKRSAMPIVMSHHK